jgi:hypothetical protein
MGATETSEERTACLPVFSLCGLIFIGMVCGTGFGMRASIITMSPGCEILAGK